MRFNTFDHVSFEDHHFDTPRPGVSVWNGLRNHPRADRTLGWGLRLESLGVPEPLKVPQLGAPLLPTF